jgi:hypothetical protein
MLHLVRVLTIASVLAALALVPAQSADADIRTLLINADDGYGTSACLAEAGTCGQVVADALCAGKGFVAAEAYRRAQPEEVTASTVSTGTSKTRAELFVIVCRPAK